MKRNLFNLSRRQWSHIFEIIEVAGATAIYAGFLFGGLLLAWFGWCL